MNYVKRLTHIESGSAVCSLEIHSTRWMAVNYIWLLVWIFIWMFDQARVRGKNVLAWLLPFALATLPPTCCLFCFAEEGEVVGFESTSRRPQQDRPTDVNGTSRDKHRLQHPIPTKF